MGLGEERSPAQSSESSQKANAPSRSFFSVWRADKVGLSLTPSTRWKGWYRIDCAFVQLSVGTSLSLSLPDQEACLFQESRGVVAYMCTVVTLQRAYI